MALPLVIHQNNEFVFANLFCNAQYFKENLYVFEIGELEYNNIVLIRIIIRQFSSYKYHINLFVDNSFMRIVWFLKKKLARVLSMLNNYN